MLIEITTEPLSPLLGAVMIKFEVYILALSKPLGWPKGPLPSKYLTAAVQFTHI